MAGGLGFADSITKHVAKITVENTPEFKLNWQGYLNMLLSNKNAKVVRLNDPNNEGHRRTVIIKSRQRFNVAHTDTARSCDQTNVPVYQERTVALGIYRQLGIHIEDETIALYPTQASTSANVGTPSTPLMDEFLSSIKTGADALLSAINQDLWVLQAAGIGVNQRSGNNAAQNVNLVLNTTNNPLNQGLTQVLTDYDLNESTGKPKMVGTGLIHNHMLQQQAKSPDQSGVNTPILANGFEFFQDPRVAVALGVNQSLVLEPEAAQLVEYMNYKGFKGGLKGSDFFFTFFLPMQVSDRVRMVEFDAQLIYRPCPTTETDAYYGTSTTVQKGWSLIISKECGLHLINPGAYRATDRLTGNRGTYRYNFTNV